MINQFTRLAILMLALAACATAPVQEMSDARQAIRSAEAVGAARRSPENLTAAQQLLRKAQTYLEAGAYDEARRYALGARVQAIKAREATVQGSPLQSPPPQRVP
ncbi:MAG: DUF4398 domain-containing protein [Candidatus Competibacteraceae bacterium]